MVEGDGGPLPSLNGEVGRVWVGGEGGYPVVVGRGVAAALPELLSKMAAGRSVALISDSNVMPLHGVVVSEGLRLAGLRFSEHVFEAGEGSKNRKTWSILTDEMLEAGHGRDSVVIGVGGGVTTDLAGFVAATFMRGVPIIQLPTSALAMIDASVGGKTGVDVRAGKNLVGAFHRPTAVLADVDTIATLPRNERGEGLVEAVKHGAILDLHHFETLERDVPRLLDGEPDAFAQIVLRSVELKAGVVDQDEFEAGYRQVLNFGHTTGHAIEAAAEYRLGHGSAVALGMRAEAAMGERLGVTEAGTGARLESLLRALIGPIQAGLSPEQVEAFLGADKKARGGRARYVLLDGVGRAALGDGWTHTVPAPVARISLEGVLSGDGSLPPTRS